MRDFGADKAYLTCKATAPAQARSGGGEHLEPGGIRDELVEGLAGDYGRRATLRRCLDLGIPRVTCVFDTAIRIAEGHSLALSPGVESVSAGTSQNRSDNDSHVTILQDHAPRSIVGGTLAGDYPSARRSRAGSMLLIPTAITKATLPRPSPPIGFQVLHHILAVG